MPRIRIERYPVQTFNLGVLGFDHLQLVYQPDGTPHSEAQDEWLLIEGLRERTPEGVRLSVEGWEGRTTLAEANGGIFGEALKAKIDTPYGRGSRVVAVLGDEHSAWVTMSSFAGDIEAQGFPYVAAALPGSPVPTINSSSLVSSLLYYIGVDIASVMPFGARLSPGTTTLLGSSGDDHLSIVNSFTAIVGGEGRDVLEGGDEASQIDKLYGGKDNDRLVWSKGFNILHGGQPGLAYEGDGIDQVSYAGAGTIRIDVNPDAVRHYRPGFVVTIAGGLDHLYSIEQIAWDPGSDHIVLGKGVGLIERPVTPELRSEAAQFDRIRVGTLEAHATETADDMLALGAFGFASYAELLAETFPQGSELGGFTDGLAGIAPGDASIGNAGVDDSHSSGF
jgi:hypothetical protein